MKHPIIDKILTEWAYRVHDGMPNPENPLHIVHLKESMQYLKIDDEVIDIMVSHLLKEADDTKTKKLSYGKVGKKLAKIKSIEQQGTVDKKVYGDVSPDDFIKRINLNFNFIFALNY